MELLINKRKLFFQDEAEEREQKVKTRLSLNQSELEQSIEASRKHVLVCHEKENIEKLLGKTSDLKQEQSLLMDVTQEYESLKSLVARDKLSSANKEKEYEEAKIKYFGKV